MGRMMRIVAVLAALGTAGMAQAVPRDLAFPSIDGGSLSLAQWDGPVLVVNTASQCGFAPQFDGLQALQDDYGARGLVVLAVPSDDFRQELDSAAEVKEYCELTFGITLPMTDITAVTGAQAHPFYQAVAAESGFTPRWNFNKVLIAPDGSVAGTWGAPTRPQSPKIRRAIEALLN
jgi:glutathione peroxidase